MIKEKCKENGSTNEDLLLNDQLKQLIIKNNIFVSGHFKINKSTSVRDWIDLERLFAIKDEDFLNPVINVIKDVLNVYDKSGAGIVLIGLNYYGAILASIIGFRFGYPFTYYIKNSDFVDEIENEIQEIGDKHLVIISPVMVYGKTIHGLVNYLEEKKLLKKDTEIDVIVLFERKTGEEYIAEPYMNLNIREINVLNDDFDIEICGKKGKCLFAQNKEMTQYRLSKT